MSRVGLGRHGQLDSDAGDPLDGLVNLFDVGIVLAVGFLVAGLSLGAASQEHHQTQTTTSATRTTITTPHQPQTVSGEGQPVGQVYRLPGGRLVLVGKAPGTP
jgi:hypothetical protein